MDRGAWWATVHGVTRVRHNLVIKQNKNSNSMFLLLLNKDPTLSLGPGPWKVSSQSVGSY